MLGRPLVSRHKGWARLLLYGLPVVLVAGAWGVIRSSRNLDLDFDWYYVDYEAIESVRLFQEYLRIDTSPAGSELAGAEFLARQLEAEGISTHVERLGEKNANLWAILEGRDPKALVLHNHIDVDPVQSLRDWEHPPFGGEIELPWIFGRGAFDMKSVTIAQLMSILELKRRGEPLARSVIFLATGTEEVGSWLGTRWILREHPDLVQRFYAVLTEGGAVEAISRDDVTYWGTEFLQKRFVDVVFCHESRQRLLDLREDLLAAARQTQRRRLPAEVAQFFKIYSEGRILDNYRQWLRQPETLLTGPEYFELPFHIQAMMRDELSPFPVVEDPEGGFSMQVILHLLPGSEVEEVRAELLPEWMTFGIPASIDVPHGQLGGSSLEHPVYRTLDQFMDREMPDFRSGPLFVPLSATDARFFRAAGIPAYGFSPFLILSTDTQQMMGANERMALPAFVEGVDLYVRLVSEMVGEAPPS